MEFNPNLIETDPKKARWVVECLGEALVDYEDEKSENFPAPGDKWEQKHTGYTVYLEGERKLLDAFAILEDDVGIYEMVYDPDEGLVGSPVQTLWK